MIMLASYSHTRYGLTLVKESLRLLSRTMVDIVGGSVVVGSTVVVGGSVV